MDRFKTLIFFLAFAILFGCNKDKDPGSLTITVSYYYNDFIGYKPDVGSRAYLYEDTFASCPDYASSVVGMAYVGEERVSFKYTGEADVNGVINIGDITPGQYSLMVRSKGRYTYSEKLITIPAGGELSLVKNFYYLHEFEEEPW